MFFHASRLTVVRKAIILIIHNNVTTLMRVINVPLSVVLLSVASISIYIYYSDSYIKTFLSTNDGEGYVRVLLSVSRYFEHYKSYPRWLPDLYLGYGSPVLSFYSPLTFISNGIFYSFTKNLFNIIRYNIIFVYILSILSFFFALFKQYFNNLYFDFLSFLFYISSSYIFIINLFFRGDIPEAVTLILLPYLFYYISHVFLMTKSAHQKNIS